MIPFLRTLILTASTALLVMGTTACEAKKVGKSILSATVGGREIRAIVDGAAFIHPETDGATPSFAGHKVVVERARVLLDGKELAPLAANATKVEVNVSAGVLTITADGAPVASQPHLR